MKYRKFHHARSIPARKTKSHNGLFRSWHRRLGLISCVLLLLLAVTGMLINHAHQLGFDKRGVQINWLLDYYGIGHPSKVKVFAQSPATLTAIDKQLWLGDSLILESALPVLSALWLPQQIVAIDAKQLYLFNHLGQLLEVQNNSTGLTPPLSELSMTKDDWILLTTADGILLSDQQLLDWRTVDPSQLGKSVPPLPISQSTELNPALLTLSRSRHLSWERVILDLHSGRLFGTWAIWFWDLAALALIFLTLSGLWIWQQKKLRR